MAENKETREVEILLNAQQANASIKDMAAGMALMNNQLAKMAQDDPRREQLKKDFQDLKARVKEARDEVNGFVKSEEQLRQESEALAQANAKTIADGQKLNASWREMKDAAGLLEKQLEELSGDDEGRQQLIDDFQDLKTRMAETKAEFNETTKSAHDLRMEEMYLAEANRQLVASGQQAGASLDTMKAAAGVLEKQLHAISADDPGRAQMIRDYQALQQRIGAAKDEMVTYVKTEEELRQEADKLNQENREVILNGQKISATFNQMDRAAKQLEAQLKDLSADDPGRKKMVADYQALQDRIEGVKKEMGHAQEETSVFTQALAFAGVTVGAEAILEGIKELGAEIVNTTKEVADLRGHINTLTGASGAELDSLTTSVLAVSRTFGKDFNEVLASSNTLSKQMGVSQQEALRLIQQGFLAGADAGGDFLDQVKEYAPQFKNAGYAADEFIGHISQASTQGIFSDKGADVVKEFGLRIREQTKSTSDAMQAAFGPKFTKEIFDGINNGSLTVQQALQRVGQEMDETQIPANQLQTVIADVFGGPGEDAGIDYLKSLKNVGKGVDELVDKTNVYTQRQQTLLDSQTELAEAQNDLTKQFEGGGAVIDTLTNQSMTVLYVLLASLGATFRELAEPIQNIWHSLTELAEQMGWVSEGTLSAKSAGELLGDVLHALFTPTRLLWGMLADVVKVMADWATSSEGGRIALQALTAPIRTLFALLTNGPAYFTSFAAAAESSFASIGRAWARVKDRDFGGAASEFADLGQKAGAAYRTSFDRAMSNKAAAGNSFFGEWKQEPDATAGGPTRAQGGDGVSDADRAKADKAREAAEKKRLADQARLHKAEEEAEQRHQEMLLNLQEAALIAQGSKRGTEIGQVMLDAQRKALAVKGTEAEKNAAIELLMEQAWQRQRELTAKYDKEDLDAAKKAADDKAKLEKETLDQQIALIEAEEQRRQAELAADEELRRGEFDLAFGAGLQSAADYEQARYEIRRAALEKELALIGGSLGQQSATYKKVQTELLKNEQTHNKAVTADAEKAAKVKQDLAKLEMKTAGDVVSTTIGLLFQDEAARKKHHNLYTALAGAKIIMDGVQEVAAIWRYSAENPANGVTMGAAGLVLGGIQTALAVARTVVGLSQLQAFSFAQGGATGGGMNLAGLRSSNSDGMAISPMGQLLAMSGLYVAGNGQLKDDSGFAVAGIVHQDEYVIPKWLREDPQVMQIEGWLEQRRLRGFDTGGRTSDGSMPAPTDGLSLGRAGSAADWQQVATVLGQLNQRLQQVEQWPLMLQVQQDVLGLYRDLEQIKNVQNKNGIGSSEG